jgi:hypothetical protein
MTKEDSMAKKQIKKKTMAKNALEPKAKVSAARSEAKKPAAAKKEPAVPPASKAAATPSTEAAAVTPTTPDPRLPVPGTVLQKRDRHGAIRCECTVEDGGIRYAGKVYRSVSSAAMAAAKDLGLTNKTQNGFAFWGLSKPPRRPSDPLVALDRAWERYHGNVQALVKEGLTDDNRRSVLAALQKHQAEIETLQGGSVA